jgi:hypothetical protein
MNETKEMAKYFQVWIDNVWDGFLAQNLIQHPREARKLKAKDFKEYVDSLLKEASKSL